MVMWLVNGNYLFRLHYSGTSGILVTDLFNRSWEMRSWGGRCKGVEDGYMDRKFRKRKQELGESLNYFIQNNCECVCVPVFWRGRLQSSTNSQMIYDSKKREIYCLNMQIYFIYDRLFSNSASLLFSIFEKSCTMKFDHNLGLQILHLWYTYIFKILMHILE